MKVPTQGSSLRSGQRRSRMAPSASRSSPLCNSRQVVLSAVAGLLTAHRASASIGIVPPMGGITPQFDLEPKAMFRHNTSELHCPDRELIHPCTTELTGYLKGKNIRDEGYKQAAYDCARTVYDSVDDFWITKNMTHLLLDLDTSTHFFDKNLTQESSFFQLGLKFGRKLIYHPECVGEFDSKDPLECRCSNLYGKIILLKLKLLGMWNEAYELFDELKAFEWDGKVKKLAAGEAFPWHHIQQTPQMFMPTLEALPVWPRERMDELPIWKVLEDNYPIFLEETLEAYARDTSLAQDAYPFLFQGGNWNQILLFHNRNYTEACEKSFPKTCAILKRELPKRDLHNYPWTSNQNEQVLVLRLKVGTDVETHCGPANNILNVHLGLKGTKGAKLIVANETYGWEEGKVIAWDGSFDHRVHCLECVEDRYIMMVRYMHPGVTPDHYRGSRQTHYEKLPAEWLEKWDKEDLKDVDDDL
ncbi:unnamed protein product [Amoebophrya sp. A25]|nr:unnamed protein product [Amoebophrya sp. A25]|eukprot:GSA25T00019974001.1